MKISFHPWVHAVIRAAGVLAFLLLLDADAQAAGVFGHGFTTRDPNGFIRLNRSVVAEDGSVYVAGEFSGTIQIDQVQGEANAVLRPWPGITSNGFIAKLDASGNWVWGRPLPKEISFADSILTYTWEPTEYAVRTLAARNGHLYVGGNLVTANRRCSFILDYSAEVQNPTLRLLLDMPQTERGAVGDNPAVYENNSQLNDLAVDSEGNLFASGAYLASKPTSIGVFSIDGAGGLVSFARLPPISLFIPDEPPRNTVTNLFCLRVSANGALEWLSIGGVDGGHGQASLNAMALKPDGTVFVGGALTYDRSPPVSFLLHLQEYRAPSLTVLARETAPNMTFGGRSHFIAQLNPSTGAWVKEVHNLDGRTATVDIRALHYSRNALHVGGAFVGSMRMRSADSGNPVYDLVSQRQTDGFVMKLTDDLYEQKISLVNGESNNDAVTWIGSDTAGTVRVAGLFGGSSAEFGGTTKQVAKSDGVSFFVSALDSQLKWTWTQCNSEEDLPPTGWGGITAAINRASGRTYAMGSYARGALNLLNTTAGTRLVLPAGPGLQTAFFTLLQASDGAFQSSYQLTVESAAGSNQIKPGVGVGNYLEGAVVIAKAPAVVYFDKDQQELDPAAPGFLDRAVKRYTSLGYEIDGTATQSPDQLYRAVMDRDIKVIFKWKLEYALKVVNRPSQGNPDLAGELESAATGRPVPGEGTSWFAADSPQTATINGVEELPGAGNFGIRFICDSYKITTKGPSGPITVSRPFASVQDRQAVPEFKMDGPVTIEYHWKKQIRIQTSTTIAGGTDGPLFYRVNADESEQLWAPAPKENPNERWFDAGTHLRLKANSTLTVNNQVLDLLGFRFGTGHAIGHANTETVIDIPNLTQPTTIAWDYGQPIFTGEALIGTAISFEKLTNSVGGTVNLANPNDPSRIDPAREPKAITVQQGPPGRLEGSMKIWSPLERKLYPLLPGKLLIEWFTADSTPANLKTVLTEISIPDPQESRSRYTGQNPITYPHVANTPPVALDPRSDDAVAFANGGLKFSTSGATVDANNRFQATGSGYAVLLFTSTTNATTPPSTPPPAAWGDTASEFLSVRLVYTKTWSDGLQGATAEIGQPIVESSSNATLQENGYVVWPHAPYNPRTYDRENRSGPIIPVNIYPWAKEDDNKLVVVWYKTQDGLSWPYGAKQYTNVWPASPQRIVIASRLGSEGLNSASQEQPLFTSDSFQNVEIYQQPDRSQPGFNPNEEHAVIKPSFLDRDPNPRPAAFALRNDLNVTNRTDPNYTSEPYVLVQYQDTTTTPPTPRMAVYQVTLEEIVNDPRLGDFNRAYTFRYQMEAGHLIAPPYPLDLLMGAVPSPQTDGNDSATSGRKCFWKDVHGQMWALSGNGGTGNASEPDLEMRFYYPSRAEFWMPPSTATTATTAYIPFAGKTSAGILQTNVVRYDVIWPTNTPVLKVGETLTFPGGEYRADHPEKMGLPGVVGFASSEIVFDDLNPTMNADPDKMLNYYIARLVSPLEERKLVIGDLPATIKTETDVAGRKVFPDLPASLRSRISYDPSTESLVLRGFLNGRTLGDPDLIAAPSSITVLQPNILTRQDRAALEKIGGSDDRWKIATTNLYRLARHPLFPNLNAPSPYLNSYAVGLGGSLGGTADKLTNVCQLGYGSALVCNPTLLGPTGSAFTDGYLVLAENNHASMGNAPISLHIIRVLKSEQYRGAIQPILGPNVFDEKITLRHSADFGGNVDDLVFEWYYRSDSGAPVPPPFTGGGSAPFPWVSFLVLAQPDGLGLSEISLAGAGSVLLGDNLFYVRWRHVNAANAAFPVDGWAGAANSRPPVPPERPVDTFHPQLAEGWVKRVVNAITPYESRVKEFRGTEDAPATYVDMIRQAGPRFEGAVALNPSPSVLENLGLIELYTTVLNRASTVGGLDPGDGPGPGPAVITAVLNAASRVAEFYLLLGNEAYTDALDPTIGFGSGSGEYGALAPTIFTFQNQVPTLLEEELALLRGRDTDGARPVYNRLLWNFTRGQGEVAYAQSYNLADVNRDGLIDEADARAMFPQGHGDAWGHYSSALKTYYSLLRNPRFTWAATAETFAIEGVTLSVDYRDERRFAQAAAARARAGTEIVDLTYRSKYVEDPDGQWQGYTDTDSQRAWGVTDWARRAGQAAYLDWVTANAMLPAEDTAHEGIRKVDRTTVPELRELSAQLVAIQGKLDAANTGLNPLGLASDVVPFDIDPVRVDRASTRSATHFEQLYERAVGALANAQQVFDHANQIHQNLRRAANDAQAFSQTVDEQDRDYRNRLIEIFGSPYEGTIGPGQPYPAGYQGPDYFLYNYVDLSVITTSSQTPTSEELRALFSPGVSKLMAFGAPKEDGSWLKSVKSWFFSSDLPGLSSSINTPIDPADGELSEQVLEIDFPLTGVDYPFRAKESWGKRTSPGDIQKALNEIVESNQHFESGRQDYHAHMTRITTQVDLIQAKLALAADQLEIKNALNRNLNDLGELQGIASVTAAGAAIAASAAQEESDIVADALPKIVGALGADMSGPARYSIRWAGRLAKKFFKGVQAAATASVGYLEGQKRLAERLAEIRIETAQFAFSVQEQMKELERLLADEGAKRMELAALQQRLALASDNYRSVLQKGLRLIEERRAFHQKTAGAVQKSRYQDMTFRLSRNDALQKFRAIFDLAARYVYLAAKAYDYETNLDPRDPASAQPLLTEIIRQRTLGEFRDGQPVIGNGGLADAMAKLKVNFDVLKGQMGFNNPQTETDRFSLRTELFRIRTGPDGNESWQRTLQNHKVENLWKVSEFRRYCRPFAPESAGPQPGLVIPFSSQIIFGRNFFGWPLGGADHSYDPTHFATKVRSVGLWFDGYLGSGLSLTPRVYLVPAGLDIMLVPTSGSLQSREWNVVDQRLPVPLPIGAGDLLRPDWIPARDSLNGTMAEIRRYSSFRGAHLSFFSLAFSYSYS